jgi:hypothetical protein
MPLNLDRVSPGDLITARSFNVLLDTLDSLDARLAQVEGRGGEPVITERIPSGDLAVPARVRLHGTNFVAPAVDNTVLLDGVALPLIPGSRPEELVVDIPSSGNLPRTSTLSVANRNGTGSTAVRLVASTQVPDGTLTITNITPQLPAAKVGEPQLFRFTLSCTTTETFTLDLRWLNVDGASANAWDAGSAVEGLSEVTLQAHQPALVSARVTPPEGAKSVDFHLVVNSLHNPQRLSGASGAVHVEVGRVTAPSDSRLRFVQVGGDSNADPFPEDPTGTGRVIARGQVGIVNLRVDMDETGNYRYEADVTPKTAPFTVINVDPAKSFEISQPLRQTVAVQVRAEPTASGAAQLTLHAYKLKAEGGDDYHGYFTFPIRSS